MDIASCVRKHKSDEVVLVLKNFKYICLKFNFEIAMNVYCKASPMPRGRTVTFSHLMTWKESSELTLVNSAGIWTIRCSEWTIVSWQRWQLALALCPKGIILSKGGVLRSDWLWPHPLVNIEEIEKSCIHNIASSYSQKYNLFHSSRLSDEAGTRYE